MRILSDFWGVTILNIDRLFVWMKYRIEWWEVTHGDPLLITIYILFAVWWLTRMLTTWRGRILYFSSLSLIYVCVRCIMLSFPFRRWPLILQKIPSKTIATRTYLTSRIRLPMTPTNSIRTPLRWPTFSQHELPEVVPFSPCPYHSFAWVLIL